MQIQALAHVAAQSSQSQPPLWLAEHNLRDDTALAVFMSRLDGVDPDDNPGRTAALLTALLEECLPASLRADLADLRSGRLDAVVVRHELLASPPPTPRDGSVPPRGWQAEAFKLMMLIRSAEGRPGVPTSENDGRLVRFVLARFGAEREHSSHSTGALEWHTEGPYDPRWPGADIIGLVALRNASAVPTRLLHTEAVLSFLPEGMRQTLERAEFGFSPSDSHPGTRGLGRVPLVGSRGGRGEMRYNGKRVRAMTSVADEALATLQSVVESAPDHAVALAPGDCLLFANHRIFHRRDALPFGAEDRWLLRLFGYWPDTPTEAVDLARPHILRVD